MKAAKTTFTADGVPYELTDTRNIGETPNEFAVRHLDRVAAFIDMLGQDVANLRTVIGT